GQMVVEPDELWVLDSSPSAGLTLITCYPFDYVGPAPRRFIVHAERMANVSERSHTNATQGTTRDDDRRGASVVLANPLVRARGSRVVLGTRTRDRSRGTRGPSYRDVVHDWEGG